VHVVMPAVAVDTKTEECRTQKSKGENVSYLFNHAALAKVFRAKMLAGINEAGLQLPERYDPQGGGECRNRREQVYVPRSLGGGLQIGRQW